MVYFRYIEGRCGGMVNSSRKGYVVDAVSYIVMSLVRNSIAQSTAGGYFCYPEGDCGGMVNSSRKGYIVDIELYVQVPLPLAAHRSTNFPKFYRCYFPFLFLLSPDRIPLSPVPFSFSFK